MFSRLLQQLMNLERRFLILAKTIINLKSRKAFLCKVLQDGQDTFIKFNNYGKYVQKIWQLGCTPPKIDAAGSGKHNSHPGTMFWDVRL
jgi:hypothetical protein